MPPLVQRQYSFYSNDEIVIEDSETDNDSDSDYSLTPSDIMNNENNDIQENGKKVIGSYYLIKNTKYGIPIDYKWLLYLSISSGVSGGNTSTLYALIFLGSIIS